MNLHIGPLNVDFFTSTTLYSNIVGPHHAVKAKGSRLHGAVRWNGETRLIWTGPMKAPILPSVAKSHVQHFRN